jgi:hypothetical protein
MKHKILAIAFVGIIFASGTLMVTAENPQGQGQTIITRWENVLRNANETICQMEKEGYNVTQLRVLVNDMETIKNSIDPDAKRKDLKDKIEQFLGLMQDLKDEVHQMDPGRRVPLRKKPN